MKPRYFWDVDSLQFFWFLVTVGHGQATYRWGLKKLFPPELHKEDAPTSKAHRSLGKQTRETQKMLPQRLRPLSHRPRHEVVHLASMNVDFQTLLFRELMSPDFWMRIGVAATCGSMLGLERQLRARPSGIRTSALICLGSSLFIHLSTVVDQTGADPTRVLGQVVTGVGFLGGGVILSRGGEIKGLTSAAVIWVLAGIGATAGFGRYGLAVGMTFVVLFTLVGVSMLEKAFFKLRQGAHADEEEETPRSSIPPGPADSTSEPPPPR